MARDLTDKRSIIFYLEGSSVFLCAQPEQQVQSHPQEDLPFFLFMIAITITATTIATQATAIKISNHIFSTPYALFLLYARIMNTPATAKATIIILTIIDQADHVANIVQIT